MFFFISSAASKERKKESGRGEGRQERKTSNQGDLFFGFPFHLGFELKHRVSEITWWNFLRERDRKQSKDEAKMKKGRGRKEEGKRVWMLHYLMISLST